MTRQSFSASTSSELRQRAQDALANIGSDGLIRDDPQASAVTARSPITGTILGSVIAQETDLGVTEAVSRATDTFTSWRSVPAPIRSEVVRHLAHQLRQHKEDLADLIQIEVAKIRAEALGEVQEMIDICDFAIGLSRQLHGLTITSERPLHRLTETWYPLGPVGIISAFNFPVAVWSWNAALALVCGDTVIWKPSELTPLCALAVNALLRRSALFAGAPPDICQVVYGDSSVGAALASDTRLPLLSATGSTAMGQAVAPIVAARFGRAILELGGNNAAIVAPSADLNVAVRGITFSAAGTAGQRCTSLRRLIVHESLIDQVCQSVGKAYANLRLGNPLSSETLVGPLINLGSMHTMNAAIAVAIKDGGEIIAGAERCFAEQAPDAAYVRPALVRMPEQSPIVKNETFAPILYVLPYGDFDEAIFLQNDVSQGLASSIFTTDLRESELFTSVTGSDCGIANVNIGPSGAEIGGAFGGEKETGGGRESGSDAWKSYMRRQTQTVNYSNELPLAQGVVFD